MGLRVRFLPRPTAQPTGTCHHQVFCRPRDCLSAMSTFAHGYALSLLPNMLTVLFRAMEWCRV